MNNSEMTVGTVVQVEGDNALVKLAKQEQCKKCGAGILCRPDAASDRIMKVRTRLHISVGNQVLISEPGNMLLKLYATQYGVPFLGFVLGIFALYFSGLSFSLIPDEVLMFCGGLLGLIFGGIIAWIWAKKATKEPSLYFEITKIIS